MSHFHYTSHSLHCESVSLRQLAEEFGTPLYVYSASAIRENFRRLANAFASLHPLVCYAVKANDNLAILRLLRDEGAGFDVVSAGELYRVLRAGGEARRVVFAGVGKTDAELEYGLRAGVGWFNVESADELAALNRIAAGLGVTATAALRLNPGVEADTHRHIATGGSADKFGVPPVEALRSIREAARYPAVTIRGVHIHIGSQLHSPDVTLRALDAVLRFVDEARSLGVTMDTLDLGGGFPVQYRDDDPVPPIETFAAPIISNLQSQISTLQISLEPGRYLVADAGALVVTVQANKQAGDRRVLVVDGGMNALIRPALYDAYHRVLPLHSNLRPPISDLHDVAGPICESADFLARGRTLPPLERGDRLAVLDAGAYGMCMASNYNAQPRPAEVMVEGSEVRLIRRRETYEDLTSREDPVG